MTYHEIQKVRDGLRPNVRKILDAIDDVLSWQTLDGVHVDYPTMMSARMDSTQLWDILSALRGPDNTAAGSDVEKMQTTGVIRSLAFPKTMQRGGLGQASFALDWEVKGIPERMDTSAPDYTTNSHFRHHINVALKAFQNEPEIAAVVTDSFVKVDVEDAETRAAALAKAAKITVTYHATKKRKKAAAKKRKPVKAAYRKAPRRRR